MREVNGAAVIEPETGPERIIERMELLVAETGSSEETKPIDATDRIARRHGDAIRRGAENDG